MVIGPLGRIVKIPTGPSVCLATISGEAISFIDAAIGNMYSPRLTPADRIDARTVVFARELGEVSAVDRENHVNDGADEEDEDCTEQDRKPEFDQRDHGARFLSSRGEAQAAPAPRWIIESILGLSGIENSGRRGESFGGERTRASGASRACGGEFSR